MGQTSNDLLHLEHSASSSSSLESTLFVCKNGSEAKQHKPNHSKGKLITTPLPSSQVMRKVRDFLGVISEANKRLKLDVKDNSGEDYDIEVLTGNEFEYIEMDLMLGIADLHTTEAVAAAESSIAGSQPVFTCCGGTESEDSSDYDDDDDDDDDKYDCGDDKIGEKDYNTTCFPVKHKKIRVCSWGIFQGYTPDKMGAQKSGQRLLSSHEISF